jgi:hypothetical protein
MQQAGELSWGLGGAGTINLLLSAAPEIIRAFIPLRGLDPGGAELNRISRWVFRIIVLQSVALFAGIWLLFFGLLWAVVAINAQSPTKVAMWWHQLEVECITRGSQSISRTTPEAGL